MIWSAILKVLPCGYIPFEGWEKDPFVGSTAYLACNPEFMKGHHTPKELAFDEGHGGAPRGALLAQLFALVGGLGLFVWRARAGGPDGLGLAAFCAAGLAWMAGVWLLARGGKHAGLPLILLCALLLRVGVGAADVSLSDDVYRYLWEGDLVAQGQSPYAFAPHAPERAAQRERMPLVYARVNHTDISAAYPIVTQLACAAVMSSVPSASERKLEQGVTRMRLFFGLCDLLVLLPLCALLRRRGLPLVRAFAWAASPLVVLEFAGSAHFDSLGILLLVGALACLPERARARGGVRECLGMLLFSAAVWTKLLPLMLLPMVLRGVGWRRRLAWLLGFSLVLHLPLLFLEDCSRGLLTGLGAYGTRWEGGSLIYRWLAEGGRELGLGIGAAAALGRGVAAAALLLVLVRLWRAGASALDAAPVLLGTFALFTPMLHPWYLTWLVPFLALRPRLAWLWLLAAAPLLYEPLAGWRADGVWQESNWTWAVLALPFAGLWLFHGRRAGIEPDQP